LEGIEVLDRVAVVGVVVREERVVEGEEVLVTDIRCVEAPVLVIVDSEVDVAVVVVTEEVVVDCPPPPPPPPPPTPPP